jgi:hypothetical protein
VLTLSRVLDGERPSWASREAWEGLRVALGPLLGRRRGGVAAEGVRRFKVCTTSADSDLIDLFKTLETAKRNDNDDGTVCGHHNRGEEQPAPSEASK